jgi:hypothetical protein
MRRFACSTLFVVALASGFWACSNDTPVTSIVKPSDKTESFSGTLTPNGAQTFPFATTGAGMITATLSAVTPDTTAQIGLSLGTWNTSTGTCQVIIANDKATQGVSVTGTGTTASAFCVHVYDALGSLTVNEAITVTVVHP